MSSAPRKPAPRLARPAARYWKGKAPKGAGEVPSDSDEEDELQHPEEEGDIQIGDQDFGQEEDEDEPPIRAAAKPVVTKSINVALKDVNISKDGKVIVAGREESGRTELEGVYSCELIVLASCATRAMCTWFEFLLAYVN
jgi:microfibrillar-associated protein 1